MDDEIIEISDDNDIKEDSKTKKKVYKRESYTAKDFTNKNKESVTKSSEVERKEYKDNKESEDNSEFVKDILKKYDSQPESKYIDKMLGQTINFMYKKFFEQENLDPETKEALTKNILNTMKLQSTVLKKAMSKDADIDLILEEQEKMRSYQEKELAKQFSDKQQYYEFKEYRDGIFNNIIKDKIARQSEGLGFSQDIIDKLEEIDLKTNSSGAKSISKALSYSHRDLSKVREPGYPQAEFKKQAESCDKSENLLRAEGQSEEEIKKFLSRNPVCRGNLFKNKTKTEQ